MDKKLNYKQAVKKLILQYGKKKGSSPEIVTAPIIDDEGGHYLVYHSGWLNNRRTYGCFLHIDIQNDKVIVQHNGTDLEIGDELVELGINMDDIVLEFLPPYSRSLAGFAVA